MKIQKRKLYTPSNTRRAYVAIPSANIVIVFYEKERIIVAAASAERRAYCVKERGRRIPGIKRKLNYASSETKVKVELSNERKEMVYGGKKKQRSNARENEPEKKYTGKNEKRREEKIGEKRNG